VKLLARGFTLIELLVVLFIISIVSGTVLMTISRSSTKDVQAVANELTQLITLAQEQAMLQSTVLGLNITASSYQFYVYTTAEHAKAATWVPLTDDAFKARSIPSDVQLDFTNADKKTSSDDEDDNNKSDDEKKIQPAIIISTNGDITPFTIYIGKRNAKPMYVIRGESSGNVTVKINGEQ